MPQIEKAFCVKGLPRPSNIAPNQPYKHSWIYKYWIVFIVLLLRRRDLARSCRRFDKGSVFAKCDSSAAAERRRHAGVLQPAFRVRGRRNIRIFGESPVQNTWVYLEGDLINEETGVVQSFPIDISYYQGVEDGESWTEGGQNRFGLHIRAAGRHDTCCGWRAVGELAAARRGCHQDRTERDARFQPAGRAHRVCPSARSLMAIYHIGFERRRWSESMFTRKRLRRRR